MPPRLPLRILLSPSIPARTQLPKPFASTAPRLFSTSSKRPTDTPMAAPTDTAAAATAASLDITEQTLADKLKSQLNASHVEIEDMSGGCGQAFNAIIVSDEFQGKSLLQRHRLVNGILKSEIAAIHAWTPRCLTGEQWEKEKSR